MNESLGVRHSPRVNKLDGDVNETLTAYDSCRHIACQEHVLSEVGSSSGLNCQS